MRWFLRRLGFYAFALWVAATLNFILPRLMPGDPVGGIMQRLTPAQIQSNPEIIQVYRDLLGSDTSPLWKQYLNYLHNLATFNFGISTSNYPTPVSEVVGRTLPYSIVLVGVAFFLAFVVGITIGMLAAWRRGGVDRQRLRADADGPRRLPGVLHRPPGGLLLRPEARLVPALARLRRRT